MDQNAAVDAGESERLVDVRLVVDAIDIPSIYQWCESSDCGAIVLFSGTVRNFSGDREGVVSLTFESYEQQALPAMERLAAEILDEHPTVRRLAMVHRLGEMGVRESTVVVAASAHHRSEAFRAAESGIDRLKESIPIWKKERWAGGFDWGLGAQDIQRVGVV